MKTAQISTKSPGSAALKNVVQGPFSKSCRDALCKVTIQIEFFPHRSGGKRVCPFKNEIQGMVNVVSTVHGE